MLFALVSYQGLHDDFFGGSDPPVAQLRQFARITFTGQDRINDGPPGGSGKIADDVVKLYVHLVKRLLHVLQVNGGQFDQIVAMTP